MKKTKTGFSSLSELLPKNKDDRFLYWVGAHRCEVLVTESLIIDFGTMKLPLQGNITITEAWLCATLKTTVLQIIIDSKEYPAVDIESDYYLRERLRFRLLPTD